MKAAILTDAGVYYKEVSPPQINSHSILVKVSFCGICGSDIPRVLDGKANHYPIILGHEFSGIVHAIGSEVLSFSEGDRVVGIPLISCLNCKACESGLYSLCPNYSFIGSRIDGAYAEYVLVPESNLIKLPDSIRLLDASMIEPCSVARHAFNFINVQDKSVCIIGSGIIGLFASQWSKILGARNTALVTHGDKGIQCSDIGVDEIISKSQTSSEFDIIIDCAGTEDSFKQSLTISGNRASIILVGTPSKTLTFDSKTWEFINRKELKIIGSWMSYSFPFPGIEWLDSLEKMANSEIKVTKNMISAIYPLSSAQYVFENIIEFKKKGRVIFSMD